jgi:hypothetical protein
MAGRARLPRLPRGLWLGLVELLALTGLAVAQPLLDVTGRAPDFFLLHRADRAQILLLVAAIVLVPPALLWAGELVVYGLGGERAQRLVHLLVVTGLFWVLALEVAKKLTPLRGRRLLAVALVVAVAAGLVYARWAAVRLWLRYLAPAPLVFALVFATMSPAAKLILPAPASAQGPVAARTGGPLPPVVMIVFDEFPTQSLLDSSGRIDRRVYPNFAGFADEATWYRNATGIGGWTPFAVPSMLAGTWPTWGQRSAVPDGSGWPDNLFTMFGRYYDLKVFETVTQLCPPERCGQTGTRSGFGTVARETAKLYRNILTPTDVAADPATVGEDPELTADGKAKGPTAWFGNLRQDQVRRVNQFIESINASDPQPTLYFLHLLLPHSPWKYLPDGRVYNSSSLPNAAVARDVWPTPVQQLNQQRHLVQLAYTDKVVARIIDRLKRQGLYDKSLVVMTADHGDGFTPGNSSRALGPGNAAELMWVPTMIKAPGQTKGRVDDRNWQHVDLLPTIADHVGLTIPWKVDGRSQTGPPQPDAPTTKTWYNHPGEPLHRPGPPNFAKVLRGVTDTLIRAHQHGHRGFYQYGATADWIYQPPAKLGPIGGPPATATIRDWELFTRVDPEAPAVPTLVVGQLANPPPPEATMVVAVNDRVAGTSGLFPMRDGQPATSFAALVPDFLYRAGPGHPQVKLYLATRTGDRHQLQPVTVTDGT